MNSSFCERGGSSDGVFVQHSNRLENQSDSSIFYPPPRAKASLSKSADPWIQSRQRKFCSPDDAGVERYDSWGSLKLQNMYHDLLQNPSVHLPNCHNVNIFTKIEPFLISTLLHENDHLTGSPLQIQIKGCKFFIFTFLI